MTVRLLFTRLVPGVLPRRTYIRPSAASGGSLDKMIFDLRSDTVTRPSSLMRQMIAEAEVGDDVFGDDPTIKKLEAAVAQLLEMEAAVFVPSGTMGNLIAVMTHCNRRGSEVILGDKSHIFLYEQGGHAQIGGVAAKTVKTLPDGRYSLEEIASKINPDDQHSASTDLICIENTFNYVGGRALPVDYVDAVVALAKERNIPVHVDGARLFNAAVSLNVPAARLLRGCASCSVCLSKGLGAPIGSVLAGGEEFIKRARRLRKALGGGMRQVGILGAAGLVALENIQRLHIDHENAKAFAKGIVDLKSPFVEIDPSLLDSNIGIFRLIGISPGEFCQRLEQVMESDKLALGDEISVRMGQWDEDTVRYVFHLDIPSEAVEKILKKFCFVLNEFGKE